MTFGSGNDALHDDPERLARHAAVDEVLVHHRHGRGRRGNGRHEARGLGLHGRVVHIGGHTAVRGGGGDCDVVAVSGGRGKSGGGD